MHDSEANPLLLPSLLRPHSPPLLWKLGRGGGPTNLMLICVDTNKPPHSLELPPTCLKVVLMLMFCFEMRQGFTVLGSLCVCHVSIRTFATNKNNGNRKICALRLLLLLCFALPGSRRCLETGVGTDGSPRAGCEDIWESAWGCLGINCRYRLFWFARLLIAADQRGECSSFLSAASPGAGKMHGMGGEEGPENLVVLLSLPPGWGERLIAMQEKIRQKSLKPV